MISIDYLPIIVSAVAAMIIGWLWYGPVFGKQWMSLSGVNMDSGKKSPVQSYVIMFLGSVVMAYILSSVIMAMAPYLATTGTLGIEAGVKIGFWAWLGFIAPVAMGSVLWEGKSWKLWFLNAGYYLVTLAVMGAIIAGWN